MSEPQYTLPTLQKKTTRGRYTVHPVVDDATGCHDWPGSTSKKGYGKVYRGGRNWMAHVWYWTQRNGPVPAGLQLDHKCRNRRCCNPDHLEPVTNLENQLRGMAPNMIAHRENRCRRGHDLTPDNIYSNKNGGRTCRTCALAAAKRRYDRQKAA